jgi:hypothetical protein
MIVPDVRGKTVRWQLEGRNARQTRRADALSERADLEKAACRRPVIGEGVVAG